MFQLSGFYRKVEGLGFTIGFRVEGILGERWFVVVNERSSASLLEDVYECIQMHRYTHIYTHVRIHAHMYTYICVDICICIYIYVCTHNDSFMWHAGVRWEVSGMVLTHISYHYAVAYRHNTTCE